MRVGVRTNVNVIAAVGVMVVGLVTFPGMALAGDSGVTFTVTKTADTADGSCSDSDCSLREAIIAANSNADDDVIIVPAGTYTLSIPGAGEDLGATGDLDIRASVDIRGAGARRTTLDGAALDRVVDVPDQFRSTPFSVRIASVAITGGVLRPGGGGGINFWARDARLDLVRSTVRGNRASQGGGIQTGPAGTMNIERSTISGNRAAGGQGGAIYNQLDLAVINSTVSGNSSRFGGGIMQFGGSLDVQYSTIAFNVARQPGGGVFINSTGPVTVRGSIIAKNKSDFAFGRNCSDDVLSGGNNLENGLTCGFDQPSDVRGDPRLGGLANNGGPTDTHRLRANSPAIDAGGLVGPSIDQRGVSRPRGLAIDIGAFER